MHWRKHLDGWWRLVRGGLLLGFDSLVLLANRKTSTRSEGAIFCLHGLGDLLLAGNAIERLSLELRARGLRTVLFVHPAWIGFARRYLAVDQIEGIDRHRFTREFRYRATVLKSVGNRFAVVVQPTFNRMLRVEDCLVRATRAAEKIGSAGHAPFINRQERWCGDCRYTKLIAARPGRLHELERYAEFMAGMGLEVATGPWRLRTNGSPAAFVPATPYLVLSPQASDKRRSWPLENFLRVARQVAERHQLGIVLIGKTKLTPLDWPDDAPELIDLSGKLSAEDLPELLAHAGLAISNDSGAYHLGVSVGCPTIAVGGSGLPERYFPYPRAGGLPTKVLYQPVPCAGCNWRCIHTRSRAETAWCLQQVGWSDVAAAADELLQRTLTHAAV